MSIIILALSPTVTGGCDKCCAQAAVAELRQASENCHHAWELAVTHGWIEPLDRALEGWLRYWELTGSYREGEVLLKAALSALAQRVG